MQQDEITSSQELSSSQAIDTYLRGCLQEDGTFHIEPRLSDMEIFNSNSEEECQNVTVPQFHLESNCSNFQNSSSAPYSNPSQSIAVPDITEPPEMASSTVPVLSSACIPSKISWTGDYGFDVYFSATNRNAKKVPWIYSAERNKLYVRKGAPCPIGITTKRDVPSNCVVKVQAMFSHPTRPLEVVKRCINHASEDLKKGMTFPDHLIRCECDSACYDIPGENGQLSVCFPYQKPQIGESCSTYIFKFMCFGSCTGGPNRRPLLMVFTLQRGGVVIGRRSVDLKICASPSRDFLNDSTKSQANKTAATPLPKKRKADGDNYGDHFADILQFAEKMRIPGKKAEAPDKDGNYTIVVPDRATYIFLRQAKFMYELCKFMEHFSSVFTSHLKSANKKAKRDHDSTDTSD